MLYRSSEPYGWYLRYLTGYPSTKGKDKANRLRWVLRLLKGDKVSDSGVLDSGVVERG